MSNADDPMLSPTDQAPEDLFQRNLSIMLKRDPELAALMTSDIDCSHIEVMPSDQPGVPTARVTLPSGEAVLLHNMKDPIGSAKRSAEKREMKAENASILLGFGMGYLAIELAQKLEKKHPLIVCEADPAVLKTALRHVDLTEVLNSDYIRILVGLEIPLQDWIMKLAAKFMTAKVEVVSYEPSIRMHPEAYERLKDIAKKESRAIILNRNTTLKAGQRMLENILQNFPEVIQSTGVKRLENLFSGRPAILVAAGPSLEKNVHLLRELEGRAVIISVDTALRLLLPLGIRPDIVTTIDFNQKNFEKFANVPIPPEISLVYHPGGYYESIRAFHGPRFTQTRTGNRIPAWLSQFFAEDKGQLNPGTTVAHLSFHLARHLGCDPIVLIGQDLAFTQDRHHASDLSLWQVAAEDVEGIEDIFGDQVPTMASFKHAIHHFEKAFAETKATVIDATEAGAKKKGTRVMRLRDVIDEYGKVPVLDIKGTLHRHSEPVEEVRMDDLLRDLDYISADLGLIQKECKEILRVTHKLHKKIDKGEIDDEEFGKLSLIAEQLTQNMDNHGRALHLMGEQNYALELYMMQHSVATIDEIEEINEKIKQQVVRAMVFYPSVARAAEFFKKPLDRMIHRLKRGRELEAEQLKADATAEDWYGRALAFSKIEYRRKALQAVQAALALDSEHVPTLKLLGRLCLDSNRLEEALQAVQRLRRLKKSDRKLETLAREAQAKHQAWLDRCVRLKAEFDGKIREDSLDEAGWFYYRVKDFPRAVTKLEAAVSYKPSPETYARLGHARLKGGDVEGAVHAWEQGIALDSTRADLYKELGGLALEQGLTEQAEGFFQEAVRHEPDDAESCECLARLYSARGAYMEAGLCYENLLRLMPGRQELVPQIVALYQRQITAAASTQ
jgi:cytochrome c-type biogenesis protein CcmH/NrfG